MGAPCSKTYSTLEDIWRLGYTSSGALRLMPLHAPSIGQSGILAAMVSAAVTAEPCGEIPALPRLPCSSHGSSVLERLKRER